MMMTDEEREYLKGARPCDHCGHLDILHQHHCCSFCTVPGCDCKNERAVFDDEQELARIAAIVRAKTFDKVQDQ